MFTIGHSNGPLESLLERLRRHGIRTVVDIRTNPASGYVPHFGREVLETRLPVEGVSYRHRGDLLGGHPDDETLYQADGRVNFALVAEHPGFKRAIDGLVAGEHGQGVALLCKEGDTLKCPRFFLIGRLLTARGVKVLHIDYPEGEIETHAEAEQRMLRDHGLDLGLFGAEDSLAQGYRILEQAYDHRAPWAKKGKRK